MAASSRRRRFPWFYKELSSQKKGSHRSNSGGRSKNTTA